MSRQAPPGASGRPRTGRKRQAVEVVADTVQFLGGRGDGDGARGNPQFVPQAPAPVAGTTSPATRRRRHPLLGDAWHSEKTDRKRTTSRAPGRRQSCFFCKDKVEEIDYKNVTQLRRYVSEKGKIRNRRITGACRRHQLQVAVAVKRAREMALLPYVEAK